MTESQQFLAAAYLVKLSRGDYTKIYETLNRLTASKFAISIPFPCRDDIQEVS